ncbi:hypothetical protein [Variovorax sp. YR752]|uniref:hypothetical protein n=1 Tax=Variovorax sp. YR752 TaxID=1884383 RepID=UPI0031376E6B
MITFVRAQTWATAIAAALLLGGCAGHGHGMHGMHGAGAGPGGACPMHADMQQKMAAAKTPEERQALMAEHHRSMGMSGGTQCPMMQPPAK